MKVKQTLIARGVWSQYLEVGIGPDAEIFTKCQPMSLGRLRRRCRRAADLELEQSRAGSGAGGRAAAGKIVGATLGNDVNLRDVEGRSALLLGKAKDNNASASLGPFIRLFDGDFTLDDVKQAEIALHGQGRGRVRARGPFLDEPDFALAGIAGRRRRSGRTTNIPTGSCSISAPCSRR